MMETSLLVILGVGGTTVAAAIPTLTLKDQQRPPLHPLLLRLLLPLPPLRLMRWLTGAGIVAAVAVPAAAKAEVAVGVGATAASGVATAAVAVLITGLYIEAGSEAALGERLTNVGGAHLASYYVDGNALGPLHPPPPLLLLLLLRPSHIELVTLATMRLVEGRKRGAERASIQARNRLLPPLPLSDSGVDDVRASQGHPT